MQKNSRRLSIEPLEDRSLLSVALGISPVGFASAALSGTTQAPPPSQTATVATQLVLRLPPVVPAGIPVQVAAFATNAQFVPVPGYTGTAALTSSDGSATSGGVALPVNVTFVNGQATFAVTFATSGSQSLVLTDSADSISGTASTAVVTAPSPTPAPTPVAATQLALFLPSTVPSGVPILVQAVAEDAGGNPVPSYAGTAVLTSTDGAATCGGVALPVNVTFVDGRATFPVVFATSGSQSLTLTDSTTYASSITGSTPVTVAAAPSPTPIPIPTPLPPPIAQEQFVLLLPPAVPNGVAVTVHAIVVGASAQASQSYSGTAVLTSSDSGATSGGVALPVNVTFVNGQATFSVTFATAGPQSLTLTDIADSISGTASTAVVTPNPNPIPAPPAKLALLLPPPPVATASNVPPPPNGVPEGALITVMAVAEDSNGNPAPSYSGTATLSITGGTATLGGVALPATVTFVDGQATLPLDFTSTGTIVLTITDVIDPTLTGTLQVTVTPPPSGPGPGPTPFSTSAG